MRATRVLLAALAFAGCSHPRAKGRIVVAVSVDWEGAYFSPEGLDALEALRKDLGGAVPLTHFVSAAYFTKAKPDPNAAETIAAAVKQGDELAVHLHGWKTLALASGIQPRLSPSFLTGTDKLLEFEDEDTGYDVDLDVYSVLDLRAMLKKSKELLAHTKLPVSTSFRAGGYLGSPKTFEALHEEGFTIDSSATDYREVDDRKNAYLPKRVKEAWPKVDSTSQPFALATQGAQLVEMPISAVVDEIDQPAIVRLFEAAHARLQKDPEHDVFVTVELNQETAHEFAPHVAEAVKTVRGRKDLGDEVVFTTVTKAAELAKATLAPPASK